MAKKKTRDTIKEADLNEIVQNIAERMAAEKRRGKVASYIPELASVDPNQFGLAVVPVGGEPICAGDSDVVFSIQSVSKVFTLILALEKAGISIWKRVGREPSGDPFNSIVQLEYEKGVPRNPFINAGAIVMADIILGSREPEDAISDILDLCRALADDETISIDESVARSETRTGYRNVALANFMRAEGNLRNWPERALDVYFHHCAIGMSCRQLAKAGHFLAKAGVTDHDGTAAITPIRARRINALMLTCGHYDASGEFAFRVGIAGKSGVGGGILGVIPGVASVAAWSPGLNPKGNSLLASKALEELAKATGWSIFERS